MSDLRVLLRVLGLVCGVLPAMAPPQAGRAQAQQVELQKLTPSDLAEGGGNGFGRGVAIWRDYIVVGAERDAPPDDPGLASGAVYVHQFEDGLWVERAKLKGSETGWEDQLGWSVAIDGDVIVAGAPHFTLEGSGLDAAAYVFRRDDNGTPANPADDVWHEEAILAPDPSDRQFSDGFGGSVAVSGDTIVAGAAGAGILDIIEFERAYVFRWDGAEWVQEAILVGSDTLAGDRFGRSVSVWGDTALVGAGGDDEACSFEDPDCNSGAAYLFSRECGTWVQDAKLMASDAPLRHGFGGSLAITRATLVAAAINSAYMFQGNAGAWTEQQVLTPSQGAPGFGRALAATCGVLVVGAPGDNQHSGSAVPYRRRTNGWIEQPKFVASDARPGAQLGRAVGVNGAYAVLGGPAAAYVYLAVGDKLSLPDYAQFQTCFGREGLLDGCDVLDFVPDSRIDLEDYVRLQELIQQP